MTRQIYVNLAVKDLDRAVEFFTELGFEFEPKFTDETATCMIVNDNAFVMLLVEERFKEFTGKDLADASTQTEAITGFNAESREGVDELVEKALAAGGTKARDPYDYGFMYGRSFNDPDGHLWEVIWMDPVAAEKGPEEFAAAQQESS
jgi:predicted lactoylglutathione lyase